MPRFCLCMCIVRFDWFMRKNRDVVDILAVPATAIRRPFGEMAMLPPKSCIPETQAKDKHSMILHLLAYTPPSALLLFSFRLTILLGRPQASHREVGVHSWTVAERLFALSQQCSSTCLTRRGLAAKSTFSPEVIWQNQILRVDILHIR